MTVLSPPPPAVAPPASAPSPEPEPASGPPRAERVGFAFAGAALCVLAALLLGFAANLTIVGHLQHSRDQQTAYDEFRRQLALGIAPVGQQTYDGKLLEPGAPVALLRIPVLGLKEVVGESTTSGVLMSGPGHRRDTPLPGQAGTSVIMGRQWGYGSPFNDLHQLPVGTEIRVTTGQGTATYEVSAIRREGDPLPPVLKEDEGRLTLITADGGPYTPSGTDPRRRDADQRRTAQPAAPAGHGLDRRVRTGPGQRERRLALGLPLVAGRCSSPPCSPWPRTARGAAGRPGSSAYPYWPPSVSPSPAPPPACCPTCSDRRGVRPPCPTRPTRPTRPRYSSTRSSTRRGG